MHHPRSWILALALLPGLGACGDKGDAADEDDDGGFFDEGDGGDGGDEGGDGGDEGGSDGGDEGGEGDEFDPTEGLSCDDGLAFLAFTRDAEGTCLSCVGRIKMIAAVHNPCDEDLSFETISNYLVGGGELVNESTGEGEGWGTGSDGSPSETWTVAAGDTLEQVVQEAPLPPGKWRFSISFADLEGHDASHSFTVEKDPDGGGSGGGSTGGGPDTGEPPPEG